MNEARDYKRTIWIIVAGIALLCAGETALALRLDNRLLLKDALEWGYDIAIYALAAISFGRGAQAERWSALAIAVVLFVAGLQGSYEVIRAFFIPPVIQAFTVGFSAISIIIEGIAVAWALSRFRHTQNALIEATWLSARNDAFSATAFALVMAAARLAPMRWPQMAVDGFAAFLAFQAAWVITRDAWPKRKDT